MGRFFNMDSPVFVALGRLADFMILNLLFLLTCIPIFTIGASCTAMSYMTLKMARNEETYIARGYFKSFKENFRQATIIWVVILIFVGILSVDFQIIRQLTGGFGSAMKIIFTALCVFLFVGYIYVFPVLSKFYNTIRNTVRNAYIMAIANLPKTVLLILIDAACVGVTFLSATTIAWGLLVWILVGFSAVSYFNSKIFVKIFDQYIPAEEEGTQEAVSEDGSEKMYEMSAFTNLQPQPFTEEEENKSE